MNAVFLDTVGLLALLDESDQWHHGARSAFEALVISRARLLTTSFVLLETGNSAARRPYRLAVADLREAMESEGSLVLPSEEDWLEAWRAYKRSEPDDAGIVDHVSFHVMRRLDITRAFTNDRHFRTAGFETLF